MQLCETLENYIIVDTDRERERNYVQLLVGGLKNNVSFIIIYNHTLLCHDIILRSPSPSLTGHTSTHTNTNTTTNTTTVCTK